MNILKISERDNVAVAIRDIVSGTCILAGADYEIAVNENIPRGHKVALRAIPEGEFIYKYGYPIGHATAQIRPGDLVHTHNVSTNLGSLLSYKYHPKNINLEAVGSLPTFLGYQRENGKVGIRNDIMIIPTVGCVNRSAELIAAAALKKYGHLPNIDSIYALNHPHGCSQLGTDALNTQKILASLVKHPNAAGVLVLGLGCENNHIEEFKKVLGEYDSKRVRFLVSQDVDDEYSCGVELIGELAELATRERRIPCPASALVVGMKCGGSDGLSGITANPLVGAFSDAIVSWGGTTVLTEVPEMFGAESILMNRAINREVFTKIVRMINNCKQYFMDYDQPIYENPSPGNKKGGITTLEDKSLGCTQKGGMASVVDVIDYGDFVERNGLNLLNANGNDLVSITALAAAGCHVILFTTGRGTPAGTAVPVFKISTNNELAAKKQDWIDFNAGHLINGVSMKTLRDQLVKEVIAVASGKKTKAEQLGFRDLTIFKNGVTL